MREFGITCTLIVICLTQTYLRGKKAALAAGPRNLPPRQAREQAKAAIKAMALKKKQEKPAEECAEDMSAQEDFGDQTPPQA
jgi:hypothetical protein